MDNKSEENTNKPIVHVSVDLARFTRDEMMNLIRNLKTFKDLYKDQYYIIFTPKGEAVDITANATIVARIDLHDRETINNFHNIMKYELWRREGDSDAISEISDQVDGS